LILTDRNSANQIKGNVTNEACSIGNGITSGTHEAASVSYRHSVLLRTCAVVVIVSLIQILSGIAILASPAQVARCLKYPSFYVEDIRVIFFLILLQLSIVMIDLTGFETKGQDLVRVNIGLNLILFLCFIVPLMSTKGKNIMIEEHLVSSLDKGEGDNNCPWSMTSAHLDSFYVSVCLDFVVHFLVLVCSLMMLRYDENRDYELVAII